ncbi:9021_t:CDS:2, partial [Funneliformis geosporum]
MGYYYSLTRGFENAMCDILKTTQHVFAIDAFRNKLILTFLKTYHINTTWDELDCVTYISIVEADISFEKTDHFDAVISITNIVTPVNVEAFIQMMFQFMIKDTHYKANENIEKLVAKDLYKSYSANQWKAIRELFQILDFTGIDDKRILSSNIVSEAFTSYAKERPDLKSAIKAINIITDNWYGYTVKSNQKKIGFKKQR